MGQKARMLTACNDPRASARHRPGQRRYLPLRTTRRSVFNFAIAIHRGPGGKGVRLVAPFGTKIQDKTEREASCCFRTEQRLALDLHHLAAEAVGRPKEAH